MTDKKQDRIRKAIIILTILLIISLLALGGVLLYRYLTDSESTVVQVPDNLIIDSSYPSSDSTPVIQEHKFIFEPIATIKKEVQHFLYLGFAV